MTKTLISVVGPTAIGKTSLGISLAQNFKTEIISADSRQFYKEMKIGTAVPNASELQAAKHHFIQHLSIQNPYTVGDFEKDALAKLNTLFKTKDYAIMVGGSGLFVKAITEGLDEFPKINAGVRETLNYRLKHEGLSALQNELKNLDRVSYDVIAIDNPKRVIRALEITKGTGMPYSSFLKRSVKQRPFYTVSVGLEAERSIIYNRINKRVDEMMKNGLLEEVRRLYPFKHLNALNTVGYKELFAYLDGYSSLEFAISEIKKNTRRFAKRQLTWFRKQDDILWFDYNTNPEIIIEALGEKIKKTS